MFGIYGQDNFFLMHLITGQDRMDLPGRSTFGLLVEDLDAYHARALEVGATEIVPPHDAEGMPRNSAVRDPSGNWIGSPRLDHRAAYPARQSCSGFPT